MIYKGADLSLVPYHDSGNQDTSPNMPAKPRTLAPKTRKFVTAMASTRAALGLRPRLAIRDAQAEWLRAEPGS